MGAKKPLPSTIENFWQMCYTVATTSKWKTQTISLYDGQIVLSGPHYFHDDKRDV